MTGSKHKSISTAKGGDSLRLEGEATVTLTLSFSDNCYYWRYWCGRCWNCFVHYG
jgi:hypothetical protein